MTRGRGIAIALLASTVIIGTVVGFAVAQPGADADSAGRLSDAVSQFDVNDAATALVLAELIVSRGQEEDRLAEAQATLDRAHMTVRETMQDAASAAAMLCHAGAQISSSDLTECLTQYTDFNDIIQDQIDDVAQRYKAVSDSIPSG